MRDMTHSNIWRDPFICVTWHTPQGGRHDSFIPVTWLIHMCDMTHSYVWHDSFTCVTWLIHVRDMTQSYVRYDSFICVTWLIHMCDMTHSTGRPCHCALHLPLRWHDSFICVTWLIHMCDMTHSHVWHDSLHRAALLSRSSPSSTSTCSTLQVEIFLKNSNFNFSKFSSKVSSCWIDSYLHCPSQWQYRYLLRAFGKLFATAEFACAFFQICMCIGIRVYMQSISIFHGCLRINEIWMCVYIYIYIYIYIYLYIYYIYINMHEYIGVRADEL